MDSNHFQNLPEVDLDERRSARYRMWQIYDRVDREGRHQLTSAEFGELNSLCNSGSLNYSERRDTSGRFNR